MKKKFFLVSAILIAALASCTKESKLDETIVEAMNSQSPINFTTYASSATTTRGTAVNSNSEFQTVNKTFDVTALINEGKVEYVYNGANTTFSLSNSYIGYASKYFNFSSVEYSTETSEWENVNSMYWPNYSNFIYFAAYSPSSANIKDTDYTFTARTTDSDGNKAYKYIFPYTVSSKIDEQLDLMYAITEVDYISSTDKKILKKDKATSLEV